MSSPKRRVYLLDVEGTVAPITLVSEQLFPYAQERFSEFLKQHESDNALAQDLILLARENRQETEPGCPPFGADASTVRAIDAAPYLGWLMDRNRKSTALKSLQGKIWKVGFENGELEGTLFADVPEALTRWAQQGSLAIYSSGSAEAQRLVFRHSNFGDLTGLISAYFDTRTGPKQASLSYATIASAMEVDPANVLFLSDVVRELDAAREAGCDTRLVVREGNAPVDKPHGHQIVATFQDL